MYCGRFLYFLTVILLFNVQEQKTKQRQSFPYLVPKSNKFHSPLNFEKVEGSTKCTCQVSLIKFWLHWTCMGAICRGMWKGHHIVPVIVMSLVKLHRKDTNPEFVNELCHRAITAMKNFPTQLKKNLIHLADITDLRP